ncbi:protein NRT1/ PTR FAMILY 5.2-like isoform X3 [Salvia divinorum]|uniref:Protein NRT1/ PTR FAMILY 5.2-like isoform X3 n=1 Tax=Salvia divinorum TaxID=28513 RepID=A0ABD1HUH3_SALDI
MPNISTMGADQFDDHEPKERLQNLSFFNWWVFSILVGTLFSNTFLIYIQDNVGWAVGYAIPTAGLAVSIVVFIFGTHYYRHKPPPGSPLTRMARVLVATMRKLDPSSCLSFLDKAAMQTGLSSPWMLSPVTQVEQTKQMVKMIPILAATFIPSTMVAQTHTLFIKQGTTLDRAMGSHFKIPLACLSAFTTIFMLITIVIYDRLFVPFARRRTKNPRGISLLQRMGIGLVIHVLIMATAFLAEWRRLSVARENGIFGKDEMVPLPIFILVPQFELMVVADNFVEVAKLEFFYDQAPEGMKSIGTAYSMLSLGIGYFLSSLLLSTVADVSKRNGIGWILNNLNVCHLDYYYAFCAVLIELSESCFLSCCYQVFLCIIWR